MQSIPERVVALVAAMTINDDAHARGHFGVELKAVIDAAQTDAYAEGRSDQIGEFAGLLPGPYYMDPPDGGDVKVLEQFRRMARDAARYRKWRGAHLAGLSGAAQFCGSGIVDLLHALGEAAEPAQMDEALDAAIARPPSNPPLESLNPMNTTYIEVSAEVRYWDDAAINGVQDEAGSQVPCRQGGIWCPVIRLADGVVMDWPAGTTADIHFKVCDAGEYWLLDDDRKRVAKWAGFYVPNKFLCHGDNGYGDCIILKIDGEGRIAKWRTPEVEMVCPCDDDDQYGWSPIA